MRHELNDATLRPSLFRPAIVLAIFLVMIAFGVLMVAAGKVWGWASVIFFGVGVLALAPQFLPGVGYLQLTSSEFTVFSLFRRHHTRWSDVERFRVAPVGAFQMVVFRYKDECPRYRRLRGISDMLTGSQFCLFNTYGMTPEALADLLNGYRLKYGSEEVVDQA